MTFKMQMRDQFEMSSNKMSVLRSGIFLLYVLYPICAEFVVPQEIVQVLTPKGLRVILRDDSADYSKIKAFYFTVAIHRVNTAIFSEEYVDQRISGFGTKQNGIWVFEEPNMEIKRNQYIVYKVFVSTGFGSIGDKDANGLSALVLRGYPSVEKTILITRLVDPTAHGPLCPESITKVRGRRVCAGETIFEDNFDKFREDNWQISHYIPIDHPEHPFVSYQRLQKDPTVIVENGTLRITPKLQQDLFANTNQSIFSGTLDLTSGCTELRICSMSSIGVDIVPPIVSGRVTSARFAFTYGTVTVRAKLPQGDWLYPEILLEPLSKKYGNLNYASGVLKIAMVCGNTDISEERYSNKQAKEHTGHLTLSHHRRHKHPATLTVYDTDGQSIVFTPPQLGWLVGGPILNSRCRNAFEFYHKKCDGDKFWGDDFHEFTLKWTPDELVLLVDGEEWGRYQPGTTGLRSWLPGSCRGDWYTLLNTGGTMAPFDDHFYLTLGVAAGGITEFSDGLTTGEEVPKPWRNRGRKAGFSFWQDKEHWLPTWTQPDLLIDYVKVVAL